MRLRKMRGAWGAVALGLALTVTLSGHSIGAASSLAHGSVSECDRACLEHIADAYFKALMLKDPSRAPFADHVKFSENNVFLMLGDGLWGTITGASSANLAFADPQEGQVGLFGVVDERGVPGFFAMRLKVVERKITEVETLVNRVPALPPGAAPPPFAAKGPSDLKHFPSMFEVTRAQDRVSRGRLLDIANGYFSTLQQNDGKLFAPFDDECTRMENGNVSAGDPNASYAAAKLSCGEQFKKGSYRFDSAVRDRGFMVVDEGRQLVLSRAFLDHNGVLTDFKLADGTAAVSGFKTPSSLCMLELFKIRNGRIFQIEVVYINVPYHMPSVWKSVE